MDGISPKGGLPLEGFWDSGILTVAPSASPYCCFALTFACDVLALLQVKKAENGQTTYVWNVWNVQRKHRRLFW
jgi:hypothetical protein